MYTPFTQERDYEAQWDANGSDQFHLKIRPICITVLHVVKEEGAVPVDSGIRTGFTVREYHFIHFVCPYATDQRGNLVPLPYRIQGSC